MTKDGIIKEVLDKTGIERTKVEAIIEALMDSVKEHITKKERVSLRGFGNFITKKRAQKTARNITKNTTIIVPAHYIPAFRPSKKFKEKVKSVKYL